MPENNKKPEIRFKGFGDDWKALRLGDIADIIGGGTPSTNNLEYWNGNIDWYSPTEIGKEIYANGSCQKITKLGLEKSSARILPADKTVLFSSRAGIGDMAILKRSGSTNQGFQSLVLKDGINPYFIYSAGHLIKEYALKHASGSTFLEISGKALGKMDINMPSTDEQAEIGTFFKNIDHNITLNQSKHDKLVNVKKAMLEKMFPKNGADIPEIRFNGFTNDWEEKKLVEFSNLIHGDGDWILSEDITSNGEYKIVQLGNIGLGIYTQKDLKTVSSKTFEMLKGTPIQKGDLLINRMVDGNVNSCIFELDGNYITSVDVCWIRENEYINNYFLMTLLTTLKSQRMLLNLSSGSGRIRISKKNLFEKFNFFLPTSDEQTKIGNFFKNLDKLLSLHKSELEKLKNIKKSMLEKMFV